ncbi:hypothetical protein SDC9_193552 [bioreactor metagenome]|uniref:Gas vesicle synthesis protein GvpL/GvpF n=1 Tax=bioreactor metagenome TaxID=1076179 RepID=A0A645IF23_9ZZZZ
MKFITIFTSEDRVKESIRENLSQFAIHFEKIQGCEEMSVKFYCDPAVYKDFYMGEELKSFEKSLAGKSKGSVFFLRKKFESEIDEKIRDRICRTANGFSEVLNEYAQDIKSNKLLAKEITGIETPMVLNCAYLVKTEQMDGFCAKCRELWENSIAKGFTIEWTGPWPPYNFCQ